MQIDCLPAPYKCIIARVDDNPDIYAVCKPCLSRHIMDNILKAYLKLAISYQTGRGRLDRINTKREKKQENTAF